MIGDILRDLRQPEYIHVLINPLPVYGLALGLIGLLVAICQRSRAATIAALVEFLSAQQPRGRHTNTANAPSTASYPWRIRMGGHGWLRTGNVPRT